MGFSLEALLLTLNPTGEEEESYSGLVAGHLFYWGGFRSFLSRPVLGSYCHHGHLYSNGGTEDKLCLDKKCDSAFLRQVARLPLHAEALGRW